VRRVRDTMAEMRARTGQEFRVVAMRKIRDFRKGGKTGGDATATGLLHAGVFVSFDELESGRSS